MIGFAAFAAGRLMGRFGPRLVGTLGGVVYGIGVALAYFAQDSLVVLYLTYGVIAGIGLGLAYIIPIQVLPKWFPDRRGFATGIAVMGFGLGPLTVCCWVPGPAARSGPSAFWCLAIESSSAARPSSSRTHRGLSPPGHEPPSEEIAGQD